jgi:hypothetical protein
MIASTQNITRKLHAYQTENRVKTYSTSFLID